MKRSFLRPTDKVKPDRLIFIAMAGDRIEIVKGLFEWLAD